LHWRKATGSPQQKGFDRSAGGRRLGKDRIPGSHAGAKGQLSSSVVEGFNTKAKLTTRKELPSRGV